MTTKFSGMATELFLMNNVMMHCVLGMRQEVRSFDHPCIIVLWDDDKFAQKAAELMALPFIGLGQRAVVTSHPTLAAMAAPLSPTPLVHKRICDDPVSGYIRCVGIGMGRHVVLDMPMNALFSLLN